MERSLDSIVEEIAQNDEMSKEFAAMDEMDEIYQYCKEAGLDCSEEEFDDEVSALIYDFENPDADVSYHDLRGVAGGNKSDDKKHELKNIKKLIGSSDNGRTVGQLLLDGRRR